MQIHRFSFQPIQFSATVKPQNETPLQPQKSDIAGFPEKDITLIKNILNHCHYQKDLLALTEPNSSFRAQYDEDKITLLNYNNPQLGKNTRLKGVCNELTYHTGQILQQCLGDRYEINSVLGQCPRYFYDKDSIHVYLLLWPKEKNALYSLIFSTPVGRYVSDHLFNLDRLMKDCLIVDPSFNDVVRASEAEDFHVSQVQYNFKNPPAREGTEKKEDITELPFYTEFDGSRTTSHVLPIGFLNKGF
jgi:hypothetical protein